MTTEQDRQAIIDLTIDYCWRLDSHDYDGLRHVFSDDASAALGEELQGLDAIRTKIDRTLTTLDASHHMVTNHQVQVHGDTATCRCYFQAQHVRRGQGGGDTFIVAGRYHDELRRTAEGWRIVRRVLHRDWTQGNRDVLYPPAG